MVHRIWCLPFPCFFCDPSPFQLSRAWPELRDLPQQSCFGCRASAPCRLAAVPPSRGCRRREHDGKISHRRVSHFVSTLSAANVCCESPREPPLDIVDDRSIVPDRVHHFFVTSIASSKIINSKSAKQDSRNASNPKKCVNHSMLHPITPRPACRAFRTSSPHRPQQHRPRPAARFPEIRLTDKSVARRAEHTSLLPVIVIEQPAHFANRQRPTHRRVATISATIPPSANHAQVAGVAPAIGENA